MNDIIPPDYTIGDQDDRFDPQPDPLLRVPVDYPRYAISRAPDFDVDPNRILQIAGIDPELLKDDASTFTPQQFSRVMLTAIMVMRDEMQGHGPSRVPPGTWYIMCHSIIHCDNLGDALRRFCKFFSLFENGIHPRLTLDGENVSLSFYMPASKPDYKPEFYALESLIFPVHRLINWLISEYIPLNTLSYSLPAPKYHHRLREYFLTTLLQFDAPVTSLTFDRRFLQRGIQQSKSDLNRFLRTGYLELFTARYAPVGWSSRLKAVIGSDLAEVPAFEEVAARFAIHPQTLRRRLAEENTTFRQLKVDVRREAAMLLLRSTSLSIEDIAARIGFSQASAFTRAFKEWAGSPPYTFRANHYR